MVSALRRLHLRGSLPQIYENPSRNKVTMLITPSCFLPLVDFYHPYQMNGYSAICHVRVLQDNDRTTVVLFSEIKDNPGPSVTKAAGTILATLPAELRKHRVLRDPTREVIFVEHYNEKLIYGNPNRKNFNRYCVVELNKETRTARFSHTTVKGLAEKTGYAVERFAISENRLDIFELSQACGGSR